MVNMEKVLVDEESSRQSFSRDFFGIDKGNDQ